MERPILSICVPAYNRARLLPELLDSICKQEPTNVEVVVVEDLSPERAQIRAIALGHSLAERGMLRYLENDTNLGYDGNIRELVRQARGRFCLFLGNDDLLAPRAIATVLSAVERWPNLGVLLRTYAAFENRPEEPVEVFRYFPSTRYFEPGLKAITAAFRRSVVISGLTIERDTANAVATQQFDGTLLYQLYLVGRILETRPAVALPEVLALYRIGGVPDFGNSASERGVYVPTEQTVESSLAFMRGMFRIARSLEEETGLPIYAPILADVASYALPILSLQSHRTKRQFFEYYRNLGREGLSAYPLFHGYYVALALLGRGRVTSFVRRAKQVLGHTPLIGMD